MQPRTHVSATVVNVVDGDTLKLQAPGLPGDGIENARLLGLDTEESNPGGNKPVTALGHKAKERLEELFATGSDVEIEFLGTESVEECWKRYRDNVGRPLILAHKQGADIQELMIREGFSPYFMKYGRVDIPEYDRRYIRAERLAQAARLGIWDQVRHNGSVMRNYAALGVWWNLRALVIDEYRRMDPRPANLLNTRLDYADLIERADRGLEACVFTELRSTRQLGDGSIVVDIGSQQQPFQIHIPNAEKDAGSQVVQLILERYISAEPDQPRRSYAYIQGKLTRFQTRADLPPIVQVRVTSTDQVNDHMFE